ncbi:F-box only protein 50 isoform X4 [Fundulus heteroclitus]|uniref:F-box only protein 50 isoform X4 n=1 Tax=Fundulus heteroclitus TaxID=8078 RepID=UPI00165C18FC|nr:F-box only protein 50 isoform X4 [Fundulus heteroclitus]
MLYEAAERCVYIATPGWGSESFLLPSGQREITRSCLSRAMSAADWKQRCETEWGLQGAPMPDAVDWKSVYEAKPLGRNLLKNPAPFGFSKDSPPPEPELPDVPPGGPPRFQPDGDFAGWTTSTEVLPYDTSGIPEGVVVCALPRYSWFTLEQVVDLKAEGLWDELLDTFQPEIIIQDWYEESQVHDTIYQLHVKLLGSDKTTVISEHSANPTEDRSVYSHNWKEVSHVFSNYGPGVRYVHFQHRLKNSFLNDFFPTLFTGTSVIVKPVKSSS